MTRFPELKLETFLILDIEEEPVIDDQTYRTAGIYSHGRGLFEKPPIHGHETSYSKYTKLRTGQFVYSKLFGWEGATAVVSSDFDRLFVSHEFPTFTIDPTRADPDYMRYIARWGGLHAQLKDKGTGVGSRRQRVNVDRLLATKVPLPDLPEQRRIAARLDASFEKLDKAASLRERRAFLQRAIFESAIGEAVTQRVGSASISSILSPSRVPVEIDPDEKYQAFGMRSFGKGSIRYEATEGGELSKLRYYRFPAGSLALSNIKAWEGAIGVTDAVDTACVASNRFLFYTPCDQRINISYLRHFLLSRIGLAQVAASSPGSADRNRTLSIKGFEAIEVPLPGREVQDRTAHLIDTLSHTSGDRSTEDAWHGMRTSLLNAAFAGDL